MRKEKIITLNDNGNTLRFKVRQLPATEQEKLIFKTFLLLANKEIGDIDANEVRKNPSKFLNSKVIFAALQSVDYEKIEPIINTLLSCCYRINGNMEEQCTPETVNGYIENFTTLLALKKAAIEVSFDFFGQDGNSQDITSNPKIVIGKTTPT